LLLLKHAQRMPAVLAASFWCFSSLPPAGKQIAKSSAA
jgi:hypothetical protein